MASSMPRPHFTPGKDPVPILQEAGWAPELVWMGRKSRPHRDSIPDHPVRSSVGIATGYRLDDPGIESRWGLRFFAPAQTGPGAHPAFCKMGTGFFSGGKERPGRDADPSPLLVPWSRKSRAICHLLALFGAHHIPHVSRIRVKSHLPSAGIIRSSPYSPR